MIVNLPINKGYYTGNCSKIVDSIETDLIKKDLIILESYTNSFGWDVDINDGNRIGYMLDGETVQTFPVKFYAEFMLDSMHQNGQNKVYGNENDIYPFVDNHGFIGWISKDPRENNPENMKEAKRRLQKSFS